jgi:cytoskeletal protein CcmA (bactofilin family)
MPDPDGVRPGSRIEGSRDGADEASSRKRPGIRWEEEGSMFGKSGESTSSDRHSHSVVQEGMAIVGNIEAMGDVRFDGRLDGKISVSERLTVGTSGALTANIDASEVVVMGSVEGSIRARKRLELRKGARVVGDVTTPILLIEEGVFFHGNSNMKAEAETPSFLGTVPGGAAQKQEQGEPLQQVYQ